MKYIVDNATPLSLLPEQSNKDLNKTWVIGLGWSHAKFLNFFLEYIGITNISLYKQ
jgi:GH15 family glucan-1,4-alpha-glucosidase